MEGVMMRNNDRYAVAVRKPDKQIEVKTNRCTGTSDRPAVCNLPIVRGVFSFVQSLTIGVKTLMYSAQFFEDEEEEAPKKEKKQKKENLGCEYAIKSLAKHVFINTEIIANAPKEYLWAGIGDT